MPAPAVIGGESALLGCDEPAFARHPADQSFVGEQMDCLARGGSGDAVGLDRCFLKLCLLYPDVTLASHKLALEQKT